jgi:hypothetical protein
MTKKWQISIHESNIRGHDVSKYIQQNLDPIRILIKTKSLKISSTALISKTANLFLTFTRYPHLGLKTDGDLDDRGDVCSSSHDGLLWILMIVVYFGVNFDLL